MNKIKRDQPYYGSQAYKLDAIPEQNPCLRRKSFGSTLVRLPWGSTQQVVSISVLDEPTPESMRFWEDAEKEKTKQEAEETYTSKLFEGVELHQQYDQERFRYSQLPFRSHFWLFMYAGGKWSFIILLPIFLLTSLLGIENATDSAIINYLMHVFDLFPVIMSPWLVFWLIGHIVINHCPRIWFRPPKGPLWELNRRTGLVTIFDYKRHRKEGVIDEFIAPFYEFDAYMITTRDRFGSYYGLLLRHRYEDRQINFHSLLGPDDFKHRPCALWDFLQNYMDVSRPIPDIPLFEAYRHLDPVTEKYDKENGRNPRYWIDMDDDTFKQRVDAMWQRAYAIDTFTRPNLMERYVSYND